MYTKIEQEIFNCNESQKSFFGICLERRVPRGAYSDGGNRAEKGMFSEEEQFYAYTEKPEESEVSTAGKVMKTNVISAEEDIRYSFTIC